MAWRFLDRNPDGTVEQISFDPTSGRCAIRLVSDTDKLLDANAALRQESGNGYNQRRDMQHVARINAQVIAHWAEVHGVRFFDRDHTEAVRRLLNSNEYSKLRIGGGRL